MSTCVYEVVYTCMCARMDECLYAITCMRACERASVRACMHARVCVTLDDGILLLVHVDHIALAPDGLLTRQHKYLDAC